MPLAQTRRKSTEIDAERSKSVARFHFTKKSIDALPLPEASQHSYWYDDEVRGVALRVAGSGLKTFLLYRRVGGKPERISIGRYPDFSIEQARGRAYQLNSDIASGKNPASEHRRIKNENTLQELFDAFLELYAKEHKRTWREDVRAFNLYLHHWRNRKISGITRQEVQALHANIGQKRGKYIANRAVELLCSLFNRARHDYGFEGTNPAAGIKAFREKKRSRFLLGEELPAFFQALAQEPNANIRDFILVALLTGARRRNVQSLEWSELSFARAVWTIPCEKAKAGEPIDVPLIPPVMEILHRRRASSRSKFVFPGSGKSGHLEEPKKCWRRVIRRAGLQDIRIHDLRRTLGSWQAALGASLPIIGKSLGHQSLEATAIYSRLQLDPVRQSVERAGQAMLLAAGINGLLEAK